MKTSLKKNLIYEYRNCFTYRINRRIKCHGNFEKKTKQNKKPKFDETTEFRQFDIGLHRVLSRIQQTKKRFNNLKAWSLYERIVIVPWIQAWSWGGFVGRVGPGTYSVISVTHTLGIAMGERRIARPWCSPPLKTPP